MKFEKLNEKIYDGDSLEANDVEIVFTADDTSVKLSFPDLVDFSKLDKIISHDESLNVQSELNFGVIEFDGEKIFKGRKKGLKLYGHISIGESEKYIFIFSCGEFQPARYQIFLEGYLKV